MNGLNAFFEALALFAAQHGILQCEVALIKAQDDLEILKSASKSLKDELKARNDAQKRSDLDATIYAIRILNGVISNLETMKKEFESAYTAQHQLIVKSNHHRTISGYSNNRQEIFHVAGKSYTRHLKCKDGKWYGRSLFNSAVVVYEGL